MIDGLELYKAIHHAKVHKESHEHKLPEQAPPPGVPQLHFDPSLEAFIEGTEDMGAIGIHYCCVIACRYVIKYITQHRNNIIKRFRKVSKCKFTYIYVNKHIHKASNTHFRTYR